MADSRIDRILNSSSKAAPLALLAMFLEGCGGSSSVQSTTLNGVVSKGPLKNAKVFADINDDGEQQANEPGATTGDDGSYSFTTALDVSNANIVALTTAETLDMTDPNNPVSTGDGFSLKAKAGSSVISPISTMVVAGISEDQIIKQLGLKSSDGNYLSADDLKTFNPFADGADAAAAINYEKAALQVFNTIKTISTAIEAGGVTGSIAKSSALSALATTFADAADPDAEVDFTSPTVISGITQKATSVAVEAQADADGLSDADKNTLTSAVKAKLDDVEDDIVDNNVGFDNLESLDDAKDLAADKKAVFEGNFAGTVNEDGNQITGSVSATDEDDVVDGSDGALTGFSIKTAAAHGTAAVTAEGVWTYTPAANYNGDDHFVVQVKDSNENTYYKTISITIASVDDAASFSGSLTGTVAEDSTTAVTGTLTAADDPDGLTNPQYTVTTDAAEGTATIDASTGAWSYLPTTANYNGKDTFTITVTDDDGYDATQEIEITVSPVDDAAVIAGDVSAISLEDQTVTGTITATDAADGLTDGDYFTVTTGAANGTASINAGTGVWTYVPDHNYDGNDAFTVTITDDDGHTVTQDVSLRMLPVDEVSITDSDGTTSYTQERTLDVSGSVASVADPIPVDINSNNATLSVEATSTVTAVTDARVDIVITKGSSAFALAAGEGDKAYTLVPTDNLKDGDALVVLSLNATVADGKLTLDPLSGDSASGDFTNYFYVHTYYTDLNGEGYSTQKYPFKFDESLLTIDDMFDINLGAMSEMLTAYTDFKMDVASDYVLQVKTSGLGLVTDSGYSFDTFQATFTVDNVIYTSGELGTDADDIFVPESGWALDLSAGGDDTVVLSADEGVSDKANAVSVSSFTEGDKLFVEATGSDGTGWSGNALNVINGVQYANVATAGNSWDVGLNYLLDLEQGASYKLTFDAKGEAGRNIKAAVGKNGGDYANLSSEVTLTDSWQTFTVELDGMWFDTTADGGRAFFEMGAATGEVFIDNVQLHKAATSNQALELEFNDPSNLLVGEFGGAVPSFAQKENGSVAEDTLKVVKASGAETWAGVVLYQASNGSMLLDGSQTATMEVYAEQAGDLTLKVEKSSYAADYFGSTESVVEGWNTITFDLGGYTGTGSLNKVVLQFDTSAVGADQTYFINSLTFGNEVSEVNWSSEDGANLISNSDFQVNDVTITQDNGDSILTTGSGDNLLYLAVIEDALIDESDLI